MAVLAGTAPAASLEMPPEPPRATALCTQSFIGLSGRVVDHADLMDAADEARLTETLAALQQRSQQQLVVATVPSLQGVTIETYAWCLANHWALGSSADDNGLLLLVAPVERKVRIEIGIGLEELLTDSEAQAIIDDRMLPAFRNGAMAQGIESGVLALVDEVAR